jgi:uncharacterized membrane protein YhfC
MSTATTVAWAISLALMILFPIGLMLWWRSRHDTPWSAFAYGALIFAVFQMFTRTPLVFVLQGLWAEELQASETLRIFYFIGLGVSAGLFESIGRWAGYKWLFRNRLAYNWRNAVAYGIGHGGIEAVVLVGLSSLTNFVTALTVSGENIEALQETLTPEQVEQLLVAREIYQNLNWPEVLAGGVERVFTLAFHIALSVIVLLVFTRQRAIWLWVAVAIHALVDTAVVLLGNVFGWPLWAVEAFLAIWAVAGLWVILRLRGESRVPQAPSEASPVEEGA